MDDTNKEYILQWSGHAASITERFSNLLARQALVDVTLICQEQKLRVHKLVLASCSLYFEEMLEQDLGQEPIILLKDLDFDILKAMVEFMYCGETTIAHSHLQSLLNAAQVFKVEDLESIVHSMISSTNYIESKCETIDKDYAHSINSNIGKNCLQVTLVGKDGSEKSSQSKKHSLDDAIVSKLNGSSNNTSGGIIDANNGREVSEVNYSTKGIIIGKLSSSKLIKNHTTESTMTNSQPSIDDHRIGPGENEFETYGTNNSLSQKINDKYDTNDCTDLFDIRDGVGECLRVYTHKKRKSIDRRNKSVICGGISHPSDYTSSPEKLSTDCIDLSNDHSCNIAPVTLTTDLDIVTNDYIWSLHTDSIRYVIGSCTMNQVNPLFEERNRSIYDDKKNIRQIKELFSVDNGNITMKRPVLRRSERLNQPDLDDNVQSSNEVATIGKSRHNKIKSLTKSRRKMKESDENSVRSRKNIDNSRTIRSTTRYTTKSSGANNNSTRCSYTKIAKDEKTKSNAGKFKSFDNNLHNKIETIENYICVPDKTNTIASVDRALWGDMSDIIENSDRDVSLPEYSLSKEIPFAVGLLPLHAALERMQAMPDYQPRKTRSSFAPVKHQQDTLVNGVKRKARFTDGNAICMSKKMSNDISEVDGTDDVRDDNDDKSSTFCHIEIHTSSQCSRNCSPTDQLVSIESSSYDK